MWNVVEDLLAKGKASGKRAEVGRTLHSWDIGNERRSDLVNHFLRASSIGAVAALSAYQSDESEKMLLAALAVGLAVESGLKATLGAISPALVADTKKNIQSAVWLTDGSGAPFESTSVKTLGGLELVQGVRLAYAGRESVPSLPSCEQVFVTRNTAAHLGVVDPASLNTAIVNMASVLSVLLSLLDEDEDAFWGSENLELVSQLRDEKASEIRLVLAVKRANAQRKFDAFLSSIPAAQHEAVFASMEAGFARLTPRDDRIMASCPVCGRDGLLSLYIREPDVDFSGFSIAESLPRGVRYGLPEYFECPVCGLVLDDEELIEEDGSFDDEFELPPSDAFLEARADWEYEQRAEMEREFGRWD